MRKSILGFALCSMLITGCWAAKPAQQPTPAADYAATTPAPRLQNYEWMDMATWYRHHADDVEKAHENTDIDILFFGDSITESWHWSEDYQKVFDRYFGQYKTLNFAIGGDQTQNLIWRLQNGSTGKLKPKIVVLMIGVNNLGLGKQEPEEMAAGVKAVVAQVKESFPDARILLQGILPSGEFTTGDWRKPIAQTNEIIKHFGDGKTVFYYNFGDVFLDDKGVISKDLMYDFLHPTPEGMALLGEKIQPVVAAWLKQ